MFRYQCALGGAGEGRGQSRSRCWRTPWDAAGGKVSLVARRHSGKRSVHAVLIRLPQPGHARTSAAAFCSTRRGVLRSRTWDYAVGGGPEPGAGIIFQGTSSPMRLMGWPSAIFARISRR